MALDSAGSELAVMEMAINLRVPKILDNILHDLNDYQLLKKDSAEQNYVFSVYFSVLLTCQPPAGA